MSVRRWESWVTCRFGPELYESRIGRHFFRWSARLRTSSEPSRVTLATVARWNTLWPDEQIGDLRYEVRRAL